MNQICSPVHWTCEEKDGGYSQSNTSRKFTERIRSLPDRNVFQNTHKKERDRRKSLLMRQSEVPCDVNRAEM